jgi:hypothetical protein
LKERGRASVKVYTLLLLFIVFALWLNGLKREAGMSISHSRSSENPDSVRILETGIRVALEEMLVGRDYARVEDILRALANESSVPANTADAADVGALLLHE